jgi:hypothetical protein
LLLIKIDYAEVKGYSVLGLGCERNELKSIWEQIPPLSVSVCYFFGGAAGRVASSVSVLRRHVLKDLKSGVSREMNWGSLQISCADIRNRWWLPNAFKGRLLVCFQALWELW